MPRIELGPDEPMHQATSQPPPLVSVITATYNRSHLLRLCIQSLLRSSFGDWEQIVVGDACTDDTEAVVAACADPRIRFVNLPVNHGEQAGPNNEGLRIAQGRYIAFLNHDDLWFPDHLETLLKTIEREKADLAFARGISYFPDGSRQFLGAVPEKTYQPVTDIHASLWLHRRELMETVGLWRLSRNCWAVPSQDWLIRAWKKKVKIVPSDRVTVLAVHAARYRSCYRSDSSPIHDELYTDMVSTPGFREREVTRTAIDLLSIQKSIRPSVHMIGLLRSATYRILLTLGIAPVWVKYFLRSPVRGGYMRRIRHFRGLPRVPGKTG